MREERGSITGDQEVNEPFTLWGAIGGNVRVMRGGKFYVRGAVYGDITVERGGRMHIFGRVSGSLLLNGGKVIHSGVLGGDAVNDGGRLFIETTAVINGKIKTNKGETKISKLYAGPPPTKD